MSSPEPIESSSDSAIGQLLASIHKSAPDEDITQHPASGLESDPEIITNSPTHIPGSQPEAGPDPALEDFELVQSHSSQPEASTQSDAIIQPAPVTKKSKKAKRKESKKEKKKKVAEDPWDEDLVVENLAAEDPVTKDSSSKEPIVVKDPDAEEPIVDNSVIEDPIIEDLTTEYPTAENPTIKEPTIDESTTVEPALNNPVEELVTEDTSTGEPIAEDHIVEEFISGSSQEVAETEHQEAHLDVDPPHVDSHSENPDIENSNSGHGINTHPESQNINHTVEDDQAGGKIEPQDVQLEEHNHDTEEVSVNSELILDQFENTALEQNENLGSTGPETALHDKSHPVEFTVLEQNTDPSISSQDQQSHESSLKAEEILQYVVFSPAHPEIRGLPESPDHSEVQDHSAIQDHSNFQNLSEFQDHSGIQDHTGILELQQEAVSIPEVQDTDCIPVPETEKTALQHDNNPEFLTPTGELYEIVVVKDEHLPGFESASQPDADQQDQSIDVPNLSETDQDSTIEELTVSRPQSVAEIVRSINEKSINEEGIQPEQGVQGTSDVSEPILEPILLQTTDLVQSPSVEPESVITEPGKEISPEGNHETISRTASSDPIVLETTPFAHHIKSVVTPEPVNEDLIQEFHPSEYTSTSEDTPKSFVTPLPSIQFNETSEEANAEDSNDTPNMAFQDRSHIASQLSDALALFNSFDESVKSLVNSLQCSNNPSISKPEQETPSPVTIAPFQVPHLRNLNFHGRFSLLSRMLGMWRPQQRCRIAVAGLGGFGKTELVVEFLYRARQVSPNTPVFWFGPDNIRSGESTPKTVADSYLEDWLLGQQDPKSLLVVDVGDRSGLFESSSDRGSLIYHLQNFQGTVILISRNGRDCNLIARPHEVCEIRALELDACVKVMWDHLGVYARDASTEREMQQVIKSLGLHPRAIVQVTKVINSTQMTVAQFYEMYSTSESFQLRLFSNIDPYSMPDHDTSVIGRGIFDLRTFRKSNTDQSRLLYQTYYLGGKTVPSSLVTTSDPLDKILLMLIIKAHFMIDEDVVNDTLSVHPMVYLAMRKALASERSLSEEAAMLEERKWKDEVVVKFSKHYPDAHINNRKWWNDSFAHLINGYSLHSDTVKIAIATIYQRESAFFRREGTFVEALRMATLARTSLPDPVPSEGLIIMQDQITLLDFLAKYREVHELLRGLTMEAGHPGNLWKKSMLAKLEVADCANRYDSAIEIFRQVRTAGEAANVDKLDLANATDDLSMALMQKGKYREAATECKKALAERSLRLGHTHTDTLSSSHNLAEILYKDGKYEEATRYIHDAIRGREAALGAEHPETVHSKVIQARIQISRATTTSEFDEAESILDHATEVLATKLSPSHPIVMTCKSEIAQIMFARGEYETAEAMNQSILAMRSAGPWLDSATHPDTMTSRNQLVEVIRLKDGCKAADNLSERCLTERTVVLTNGSLTGEDFHPDQLSSLHNRAVILSGLGQHLAALQKIDLALLGRKAILGERHPDYFNSMTWKGEIMRAQLHRYQSERTQTLDTIENLHKQAYEGLSWIFGSEHQSSLQCATHMALAKRERGGPSSSEAEGIFRQIHCAYQHNMGDFHPETLKSKGRLAEAMRAASPRHHVEAKKLWRDSCGGLTRIYGFDAHVTANAYKGYEKFLRTYPDP